MLTAFVTRPPSSAATTCSATITPARSCASLGRGGEVRRDDDVVELEQRPRVRLLGEDVERRAGDLAGAERLDQRLLVDELAAGGVDDAGRRRASPRSPRGRSSPRVSGVSGRCSVRNSAAASTSSSVSARSTPSSRNRSARDERVVGDDAHPEPERAARDLLADAAEAEHAERLAGELDAAPARALPAALLERGVRLRDVARERDEQADRVLGRRDDRRLGRVRDDDPAARRRLDVDVVDADARAADHLQPRRRARSARRSASSPSG